MTEVTKIPNRKTEDPGLPDHKVVTSQDLWFWLMGKAGAEKMSDLWKLDGTSLITLRKIDILNSVWATYSPDENTTGIYISGYSVGDGKSGYDTNQNVIAADIAYREAGGTPEPLVRFKVYLKNSSSESNIYYAMNNAGENAVFVVRTVVPIDQENITISNTGNSLTNAGQISFDHYDSTTGYYYYEFTVTLATENTLTNTVLELYPVTQGSESGNALFSIPAHSGIFITCPEDLWNSEAIIYIDNIIGSKATFAVLSDLPNNTNRITVTPQNTSLTSAGSIVSKGMHVSEYHYTFDVTLNSLNTGSAEVEEYFEVSLVGISPDDTANNRTNVVTVIIRPSNG